MYVHRNGYTWQVVDVSNRFLSSLVPSSFCTRYFCNFNAMHELNDHLSTNTSIISNTRYDVTVVAI